MGDCVSGPSVARRASTRSPDRPSAARRERRSCQQGRSAEALPSAWPEAVSEAGAGVPVAGPKPSSPGGMGSSDDGAVYAGEAFPGCVVQPEQRQSWNAQKKTARFLPKEEIKSMFCACAPRRETRGRGTGNGIPAAAGTVFSRPTDDALSVLLVCLPLVTFQLGMCAFCDQGELHQKLRFFYPRIPAAANRADFRRILILPETKKRLCHQRQSRL